MKFKKDKLPWWVKFLLATKVVIKQHDEDFGEDVKIGFKWKFEF